MRIKGLVAAANRVREQLKRGVAEQEVPQFKSYIQATLLTVERLCLQQNTTPNALPFPSRKAYRFLQQVNLSQIPVHDSQSQPLKTLRLANIKQSHHTVQAQLWNLVCAESLIRLDVREIRKTLVKQSDAVEKLCHLKDLSPQQLEGFSRSHYSWLKFLQTSAYLEAHLQALYKLKQQILLNLAHHNQGFFTQSSTDRMPQLWIEFTPMKALYRHTQKKNELIVRVCEGLIVADDSLVKTLGQQIVFGKTGERTQQIRHFCLSEEYQEILLEMDLILGQQPKKHQGRVYNLEQMFIQLNQLYFEDKLSIPILTWSESFTHRKFGHYCRSRNQIMLSQTLDDEAIPETLTAYVLYYEMLHIKHGAQWINGRLWVHTQAFKEDERRFPHFELAEKALSKLAFKPLHQCH